MDRSRARGRNRRAAGDSAALPSRARRLALDPGRNEATGLVVKARPVVKVERAGEVGGGTASLPTRPHLLALAGADPAAVDLSPAGERAVGEWARQEHGSDFVFVTGYPMAKRPFYTHPDPARPAYSYSFDLLFRGVELVTGGQRRHRYGEYVAALTAAGEPLAPYESYLEVFRHGMPPHGGFAIGLERFLARLLGAGNVREVTTFPRDLHRLTP